MRTSQKPPTPDPSGEDLVWPELPWRRTPPLNPKLGCLLPFKDDVGVLLPATADPLLKPLLGEYAEVERQRQQAQHLDQPKLEAARDEAHEADLLALGEAARAGADWPEPTEPAAEEKLEEHLRLRLALDQVLLGLEVRVFATAEEHADEILVAAAQRTLDAKLSGKPHLWKRADAEEHWLRDLCAGTEPRRRNSIAVREAIKAISAAGDYQAGISAAAIADREAREAAAENARVREYHQRRTEVETHLRKQWKVAAHHGLTPNQADEVTAAVEERYPHLAGISKRGSRASFEGRDNEGTLAAVGAA